MIIGFNIGSDILSSIFTAMRMKEIEVSACVNTLKVFFMIACICIYLHLVWMHIDFFYFYRIEINLLR
jgi:hypothetical protein